MNQPDATPATEAVKPTTATTLCNAQQNEPAPKTMQNRLDAELEAAKKNAKDTKVCFQRIFKFSFY